MTKSLGQLDFFANKPNKAFKSDSQRLAVSLRSSIAKRRSHLNAALGRNMEYHLARVIYQYRKLPAIREGMYPHFGGNLEFELYGFFEVCYHLKDWIREDERYSSMDDVEKYINSVPSLRICADLCNRLKHRKKNNKLRSKKAPGIFQISSTVSIGPKGSDARTTIDSAFVETERGTECCFSLARECLDAWGKYLKKNKIECYFP
ncbi:hypothetical protein DC844_RS22910 [Vibrio parahaemolyticus]|nr:hypothetical protein [Vibrio parahaemolyticus]EJC6761442.1 hypothetical protein [Vibrio parahaemolyticus]EJD3755934.1 hypothetical protein [Vibrio parahaemolyticus]EJG0004356.1 hypothetical protein [Vibrio parahaemolyticus]